MSDGTSDVDLIKRCAEAIRWGNKETAILTLSTVSYRLFKARELAESEGDRANDLVGALIQIESYLKLRKDTDSRAADFDGILEEILRLRRKAGLEADLIKHVQPELFSGRCRIPGGHGELRE
jgi:hypothetical protein